MDNEINKESHKEILEHEEVSAVPGRTPAEQEADAHGHGHGHGEDDVIVWHQEKLLPTILMASALVVVTLFGLSVAGNTKLDISTGKAAYDKVEQQKPKIGIENAAHSTGNNMNNVPPQGQKQAAPQGHEQAVPPTEHQQAPGADHQKVPADSHDH